jgi:hypothetical protein
VGQSGIGNFIDTGPLLAGRAGVGSKPCSDHGGRREMPAAVSIQ